MSDRPLRCTAGELAKLFSLMPPDLKVSFEPITNAWLGTSNPMRVSGDTPNIYGPEGNDSTSDHPLAYAQIYLFEDRDHNG